MPNPFLSLNYETALEDLGDDYYDPVPAAEFPERILRFRNDELLPIIGLQPEAVSDDDFIEAFGSFEGVRPFLALRYHGYQFGEYNPSLGDGRGFLYGQVRGVDGELYDFGTKGSGRTPYSRSADGRLTLKGGVREVLAAEALHQLGVKTSRCLSLIETGEALWRGDEPSPTRSSVMVRFSRSHIRFGTFERLHYFQRPDLIGKLLNHVIEVYYPLVDPESKDCYALFYAELVRRVARLAAQWMVAGFCHGVLNTDNMSITGESFDYGPYAFIPTYDLRFTAAYFDYGGRYSYGNQPGICQFNLEMLQVPLRMVADKFDLEAGLAKFPEYYYEAYRQLMVQKLGFTELPVAEAKELLGETIQLLQGTQVSYHGFFAELARLFSPQWREDAEAVLQGCSFPLEAWQEWRRLYYQLLNELPREEMEAVERRLRFENPQTALLRPQIEAVWEPIVRGDDWQPFYDLLEKIRFKK
ncbi:YdiU family protein [Lusitaniella coriacea LEGE 07157]|uniref:Protein nucleotidyltransferase YdiU n=1 Tax=Lusitaniella coriacea LEGE 07157 TaxID=945747 RepID=A0A8J7B8H7_9CYAN|nr:YdiU family protein [Lusitaniella coriacea]MBE9114508.1 YdiU family protein [Lusitaniella coriacea LEGE 07157]